MLTHPAHWSLADRFAYEFSGTTTHLRTFRKRYVVGALLFVLVVSTVTWVRTGASLTDLPAILLASLVHLLRSIAVVSLLFAWLAAIFIQDWLYERTSNKWTTREALRRPGACFQVPHWRFYIPSVAIRYMLFVGWLAALFCLLFVLPARISGLEAFIPENFPI